MATFSDAIKAMTEGKAIRRAGWNPCVVSDDRFHNYGTEHYRKTNGEIVQSRMEWLASDMAADDWEILDSIEVR